MSNIPSHSPLSPTSDYNGDGSDLQDTVPASNHDAQPPNTTVMDGIRPHNTSKPIEPVRPTFASTIKLGLRSHGSDLKSTLNSKLGPQYGLPQHPRNVMKGDSSNPSVLTPPSVTSLLSKTPDDSITEFSACCLLGKI